MKSHNTRAPSTGIDIHSQRPSSQSSLLLRYLLSITSTSTSASLSITSSRQLTLVTQFVKSNRVNLLQEYEHKFKDSYKHSYPYSYPHSLPSGRQLQLQLHPNPNLNTTPNLSPNPSSPIASTIMATPDHCLYCFEVLTAHLEKRQPLDLEKVQELWTSYPKGLELQTSEEEEEEDVNLQITGSHPPKTNPRPDPNSTTNSARHPILQRITRSASGTSTPSSSSSSERTSTSNSTSATTPSSSTTSFTPIGISPTPRHTTQLSPPRSLRDWSTPLFVTWNTLSSSSQPHQQSPSLRGCIGTFSSEPLLSSLPEYALISALHDSRFDPITLRELPTLEVAVTLLTDFEECDHPLDWDIGVHGIRISFYHKNKRFGACYLPDVAVEQDWGKEETVVSAMRKAGWGGKREKWREVSQLHVVRYQGRKESVSWKEYNEWRTWVQKTDNKAEARN